MRDDLFVLGAAAVAVVCCFGVSLLVAAGATTVLGLAGVALPARRERQAAVSEHVRRAGRGTDATGALVVWSVAEGRRGRRWREVRSTAGGGVLSALLLETDPGGHFVHTEFGTASGLLTLHPETDGTLHGNVVAGDGVQHVAGLRWAADAVLLVEGSTLAAAAAAHGLRQVIAAGTSESRPAVFVDLALAVRAAEVSIERDGEDVWRLGFGESVAVDGDGLPLLAGARIWPLEVE